MSYRKPKYRRSNVKADPTPAYVILHNCEELHTESGTSAVRDIQIDSPESGKLEDEKNVSKPIAVLDVKVILTESDKIKCEFVKVKELLKNTMADCKSMIKKYGDDSKTTTCFQLLHTKMDNLRDIFQNLKLYAPEDEISSSKLDVEKFEELVEKLQDLLTDKGVRKYRTRSMPSSIQMPPTSKYFSDSSGSDVEDAVIFRRRKRLAVSDDSDSSGSSNSSERASNHLEKISDSDSSSGNSSVGSDSSEQASDSSEGNSSEDSNSSERASDNLKNISDSDLSEADSSEGSNSSERASCDIEKISKAKKRRKLNGNVENDTKNGDWVVRISDGKVKKYAKASNIWELENICLVCGPGKKIAAKHPLFTGGLCKEHLLLCHEKFFEYDSDGYNSSCCICSMGTLLVVCDKLDCGKCYCRDCLTRFIDSGVYSYAANSKNWMCNFCKNSKEGLLRKRAGWQEEIQRLYKITDPQFPPLPVMQTVPEKKRKPIRVLSLFDGISTGAEALKQLGIEIGKFVASEIDEDAVRLVKNKHPEVIHIGDITKLSDEEIYDMGPFDLVLGGSPCNDFSNVNPKWKGPIDADGTNCPFFDYYRILRTVQPPRANDLCFKRPFFWLFENVTSIKETEKQRISRFLQCEPRMADARYVSAVCRSRLFWGNLPGLMDKELTPGVNDRLTVQECLESCRKASVEKLNTITCRYSNLYQGPQNRAPVVHDGKEDVLSTTEVERVFGVPKHYTDVNNIGPRERVALLGRSWSVPVVRQLLSPLRDYFKCNLD